MYDQYDDDLTEDSIRAAWTVLGAFLAICAIAVIAVLLSGCSVLPPPATVPGTTRPASVRVAVTVLDADRAGIDGLHCTLTVDGAEPQLCTYNGIQAVWQIPAAQVGWGAELRLSAEGFTPITRRIVTATDLDEVTLTRAAVALPRLVPAGQYFRLETGERWTWIGASAFNLLNRFRHGEDIEPVLQQLQDIGFTAVRVFTVYDICPTGQGCQAIGRSEPTPDLYAAIPGFARALAAHGLYAELVAFTGPYGLVPTDAAKVQHWEALIAAVQGTSNLTLELINEADHPANAGVPLERMRRPSGVLASHGSRTQDEEPVSPPWDYATYRPAGGEWARKVGHNAWEVAESWQVPVVSNETVRYPDNEASEARAFDAAAGATLFVAGAVFHSVSGKAAVPLSPAEVAAARAWVAGARSVPLTCQGQPYRHLDDGPFLRVYQRGSDPACIVRIRR